MPGPCSRLPGFNRYELQSTVVNRRHTQTHIIMAARLYAVVVMTLVLLALLDPSMAAGRQSSSVVVGVGDGAGGPLQCQAGGNVTLPHRACPSACCLHASPCIPARPRVLLTDAKHAYGSELRGDALAK